MPRRPRLPLRGATFHVGCRDARSDSVFDHGLEAIEFIEVLGKVGHPARSPHGLVLEVLLTLRAIVSARL